MRKKSERYFPYEIQISLEAWEKLKLGAIAERLAIQPGALSILFYRHVANRLNQEPERQGKPVKAGNINLYALLTRIFRYLLSHYIIVRNNGLVDNILNEERLEYYRGDLSVALQTFVEHYPGSKVTEKAWTPPDYISAEDPGDQRKKMIIEEFLLLRLTLENPALAEFADLFDDPALHASESFSKVLYGLERRLAVAPPFEPFKYPIMELLRLPLKFSPSSISGQLEYIRNNWAEILPPELLSEIVLAFDILHEEEREWWGGPGKPQVLEFGRGVGGLLGYPEYERFSLDADWMSNVVMIAKMVYVWLDQLSKKHGRYISKLDEIPDEELDRLARWGFNCIWLIGVWERSPASQKIKQMCGNPEAVSSAYSLYDYTIAWDLGGEAALKNLKDRAWRRGIRLASDMVPNHTGIYSKWTREHPDWFIQLDYPPYPSYSFNGTDLSFSQDISLYIEDGYWDRRDAAVVFKHVDNHSGRTRYIYHGNDGTSTPWNDTAQLNYLIPEVREAVIRTIIHVARQFPIIRFDAAMTLAKKHYQRLWFPQPGHGSGIPSRAEHGMSREHFDSVFPIEFWREVVDRMAVEAPDTLLLAEAFWLMEGYFVRTLGMHRVYNSAFMNMLKMEENAKYRQTLKNILEFNPEILKRFVNFMSNPDERTAIDQFGKEGKYFGAAVLLVTMPGLPMFGHGQIEGFTEKYGMEYRRAYWEEEIDWHLVTTHEAKIFPLMKKRWLFSGSANFVLYDFFTNGHVDENVFAYSNRAGGERGLILYHNKYGSTSGWIRTSCASAVRNGNGETSLAQTTLGSTLDFNHDGRYYYAFRDYASGLEYLRHGPELVEKGMYVELEAYEYHAFLDFREIRDDEYGTWGALCHQLQGRPVESVDEEVKQIRYGKVIASIKELYEELPKRLDTIYLSGKADDAGFLHKGMEAFLSALSEHTGGRENVGEVADRVIDELELARKVIGLRSRSGGESHATKFVQSELSGKAGKFNRLYLTLFLTLHRTGAIAGPEDFASRSALWFDEFGLRKALQRAMHTLLDTDPTLASPWGTGTETLLMKILITHQSFFSHGNDDRVKQIKDLFQDENIRQFLLIHWSNGVEWFNKERFEDLIRWLYMVGIASTGGQPSAKKNLEDTLVAGYETVMEFYSTADAAHYRTDLFHSLAASGSSVTTGFSS